MAKLRRVKIPGSERALPPDAWLIGPADPDEELRVSLILRRGSAPAPFPDVEALGAQPLGQRRHLSRRQFAARHGARREDLAAVRAFARAHRLTVEREFAARRTVVLRGRAADFGRAFGVQLQRFETAAGTFRAHEGPLRGPRELAAILEGVFGLDNRLLARPHYRWYRPGAAFRPAAAPLETYTAVQIAALYRFPATTAAGQCIGILELGGGFRASDLETYFQGLGLPRPTVTAVAVDGASNQPTGDPNGPDGEVALDIEVAGAAAPGAAIAVYFAPNTDQGFLDALTTAIHDRPNQPAVVSVSWGSAEAEWSAAAKQALNSACQDAAAMGVTICVASGDDGSSDGMNDGQPHVDFPASSPYVLGCGGTKLVSAGQTITAETAWDDLPAGGATGGGVSTTFPLPSWQRAAQVPLGPGGAAGRGVPDVAGDAAPETGYQILVDGQSGVIGGTSAVAPLWAALVARLNSGVGQAAGFLNPLLYGKLPTDILNDITRGSNGQYSAGPGWDPCTGLGSPNGAHLAALMPATGTGAESGAGRAATRRAAATQAGRLTPRRRQAAARPVRRRKKATPARRARKRRR